MSKMEETLKYLYSLEKFGISLGLHKIAKLLEPFDNPQDKLKVIHIAGTNGKGSTASIIESILIEHGFKVGLYTSPHLVRFNERIRINKKEISDEEIVYYTEKLRPYEERIKLKDPVTFFDFTTAMAYLYFFDKKVDYAIMEVGLGGTLDSTNIVKRPELAIITNISKEHEQYLGNNIEDIAKEKAGIIKENIKVITGEEKEKPLEVIKKIAKERNSKLFILKDCCKIENNKDNFNYYGINYNFNDLKLNLLGIHQIKNASLAILSMEVMDAFKLDKDKIKKALFNVKWQGRLEILKNKPLFLIDGAHNPDGAKVLRENLKTFKYKNLILIMSIMEDKDLEKIFSYLAPLSNILILTKASIDRASNIENLEKIAKKYAKEIYKFENISDAVKFSLAKANKNDLICFTGSLYAVGDLKKLIEDKKINL